ncbi:MULTISPECIES: DUF2933 domain-containing protein [unclassified Mesorhizobium]|uniref:DUF2933 domain-containing protein n=1 Tax=unclassified Mesorhizobium TaxID=325217 RepID=UPI003338F4F3
MNTNNVHRMSDPPTGSQPEPKAEAGGCWTSKAGLVTIAFLLIAAFFLLTEHRAHTFGVLPFLLLLACPLLHMSMHGGHRGHGGHARRKEPEPGAQDGITQHKGT